MKEDFVHLHTHSDMSQLDGCAKVSDYAKEASSRGNPAVAITDHGTMRGCYEQLKECQEANINPIFGIEFYVSEDMHRCGVTDEERDEITRGLKRAEAKAAIKEYEDVNGIRDRWHLTVWAKNKQGIKNLFALSTAAYLDGFYYKPRIDLDALVRHKEGLMVATGCLSSPINDRVSRGMEKSALEKADLLYHAFDSDLWLEVQPHAIAEQRDANRFILDLQKRYGGAHSIRLLATQDSHYIHQDDHKAHDVMLCIGTGSKMQNTDRFRFDGDEFHMRTRVQMIDAFNKHHEYMTSRQIKEAIDNTMVFADEVDPDILKIDYKATILPPIDMPGKYSCDKHGQFRYLKDLCIAGWDWREIPKRARRMSKKDGLSDSQAIEKYRDRLKMELRSLVRQQFVPYFLLVEDIYRFARKSRIICGPGRGSGAGSLIAFLIGITAVDPLEHGLMFERFISPGRIDLPDFDMDFPDTRRQEIIDYLRDKYGHDKVAQIATVSKLSGKECIKSVARVYDVPYGDANEVTKHIIKRTQGDKRENNTVEDSLKESKACRDFHRKYPDVFPMAMRLEGMAKNLGIHAAGVVTSPVPLVEIVPLETRKHNGQDVVVTAVDMKGVAAFGLVKLDDLGLRTLSVLGDAVEKIRETHGVDIDLERIELDDSKVLQGFTDRDYVGVFQYDSHSAHKICAGVEFTHFNDIAAMTALNRPGTINSGLAVQYVKRKKNPKLAKRIVYHKRVSDITQDTLGVIVYQEHVIRIFTEIAGFEATRADKLRKKIGKKLGVDAIREDRDDFIKGAVARWGHEGLDEDIAGRLMDAIQEFGKYSFNKSHATSYAVIGYHCMWLKIYYPLEFYWALMKNEPDRDSVQQIAKDARRHGVQLLPPDVSISGREFSIDYKRKAVRGSLVDIKDIGDAASRSIEEGRPYSDMFDFLGRVNRRCVNKKAILALAKAGALEHLIPNPKWFVEHVEEFLKKSKSNPESARYMLESSAMSSMYAVEERQLIAGSVNPLAFGKHPVDIYADFVDEHIKVPISFMSDNDFWSKNDGSGVFVLCAVEGTRVYHVGDFEDKQPSPEEMRRKFWGMEFAKVDVDDPCGSHNRIKFDIDVFEDMKHTFVDNVGSPLLVHVGVNEKFNSLRAHFAVDLEVLRKKLQTRDDLTVWDRIAIGKHPVAVFKWPKNRDRRIANGLFRNYANGSKGSSDQLPISRWMTGVITHVRLKYDKNDKQMAFFGVLGADGYYVDATCFASCWDVEMRKAIRPGRVLKIQLERQWDSWFKRWSFVFSDNCRFQRIPIW